MAKAPASAPASRPKTAARRPASPPPPPVKVAPLFRQVDWLTFGLGFLLVMAAYFYTLAPDLTLEDSGELAVGSHYAGIPHPPGYPVWTIYTWVWANFLPFSNIAWRVALASAFAGALACGLIALLVSRGSSMLMEGLEELKDMTGKWEAAICVVSGVVAAGLMGFNGFMWSQSVIVEVYSFGVLSLMLTMALLLRWIYAPHQKRYLYWSMFMFGICFTNHQSLLVAAMGLQVAIALAQPRLGRDVFLCNSVVYVAGLLARSLGYLSTFDSPPGGGLNMLFVIFNAVGLSSIAAYAWLAVKTTEFFNPWNFLTGLGCGGAWLAGAAWYLYMPIAGMSNPPMQWGYPRTVEGFIHALTRGQYEKANPTNFLNDPGRFVEQLGRMVEGVAGEFSWVFMFIALVPFFFLWRMKQRERAWIVGIAAVYFCLGVILLILLNPPPDRAARDLVRVFFTPSHTCIAMLVGYGLSLTAAYMATHYQRVRLWGLVGGAVAIALALFTVRERTIQTLIGEGTNPSLGEVMAGVASIFQPGQFGLPVFSALLLLLMCAVFIVALLVYRDRAPLAIMLGVFAALPATSYMANWADNEQRGHLFGYWFGHDMFSPPFKGADGQPLYPEMTRDAILYGGTDPGRFAPTYMIFSESFTPGKHKRDPDFDRRDVYIITQNALADGTYLNYIRAHYNKSEQIQYDTPFFSDIVRTARQREQGRTTALSRAFGLLDNIFIPLGDRIERSRRAGSSMFEADSFTDLKDLADRLRGGSAPTALTQHLREQLSPGTRKLLDSGKDNRALARALAADFNRLIERDIVVRREIEELTQAKLRLEMGFLTRAPREKQLARVRELEERIEALKKEGTFYTPERFAEVNLGERLRKFVAQDPWTWNRIRMNRLLLEAAFPQAIAPSPGGLYPDLEMYITTPAESQRCFQEYLKDAEARAKHDQQNPHAPRRLKPGEDVRVITGPDGMQRVQVSGQVAVMAINGLITKDMFDKNPENDFFVEESFPLDWMFPHLTPYGIIMKVNREVVPELTDEVCQRDHEFWRQFSERLIGDWITYDTTVEEITDFARRTYLQRNYRDFKGDLKFARDDQAQKAFSKLRSSIGGLYAWRLGLMPSVPTPPQYLPKNTEEQKRLLREAEFALKQALAFCPYSPEAVFRYVQLLLAFNRIDDALKIAETCLALDPENGQVAGLVRSLQEAAKQPSAFRMPPPPTAQSAAEAQAQTAAALAQLEREWRTQPDNLQAGFNLASALLSAQQNDRAAAVLDQIATRPNVDFQALLTVARALAELGRVDRLEPILEQATRLDPDQPEVFYDLAALRAMTGKRVESLAALERAMVLNTARRATNPAALDLRAGIKEDNRFDALRQDAEFRKLVGGS